VAPSPVSPSLPPDHRYEDDITLVLVTSAILTHPDTTLTDAVLHSACRAEPVFALCRKIIVADFPRTVFDDDSRGSEWKAGRFNKQSVESYYEYLDRVEASCKAGLHPYHNAELIRAPKFRGFALALKMGLEMCKTPYVAVFQHDRVVLRPFGLERILRLLRAAPGVVNYVGLASNSTLVDALDEQLAMSKFGLSPLVHGRGSFFFEGTEFLPLYFWFDSTHVASVRFYLDEVMKPRYPKDAPPMRFKVGDFVEDKYGQKMRQDIKEGGLEAHAKYGTFIPMPADGEMVVQHVNGRMMGSTKDRTLGFFVDELGWDDEDEPEGEKVEMGDRELADLEISGWDGRE
jgi:hypothetical protein